MKYICQCIKGADHLTFEIGGGGGGVGYIEDKFLANKKDSCSKKPKHPALG